MAWDSFLSDKHGPPPGISRKLERDPVAYCLGYRSGGFWFADIAVPIPGAPAQRTIGGDPHLSLAEAAAHKGEVAGPFLLQGTLMSQVPVEMPDSGEQVIAGKILLTAKDLDAIGEDKQVVTLFQWEQRATQVQFGDDQIQLSVEVVADLPLVTDRQTRVDIDREGSSARTSKPVTARLGKLQYSLKDLGFKRPLTNLERAYLPNGEPAVLIAGIAEGGKIVAPPKGRLGFHQGNLAQAKTRASNLGTAMIVLGMLLVLVGSIFRSLGKRSRRLARLRR